MPSKPHYHLEQINASIQHFKRGYRSNKYLDAIRPKVHMKQRWFLAFEELEVFFGGAAGGSKSDSLLMGALQYVDVPGYAAILFRRTFADLTLPGALMDRANSWFSKTDAIKKDGGKRWDFPGGGSIQFAYLAEEGDKHRYQSAEFSYVGFDELSHFSEESYAYLFSRLRRPKINDDDSPQQKREKAALAQVPLRMRSASNPGGKHGEWVKNAFITKEYMRSDPDIQFSTVWAKRGKCNMCFGKGEVDINGEKEVCFACKGEKKTNRYFIPARLQDNPSVDQQSYRFALSQLPPEEREQLENGRWDIVTSGVVFKKEWIRRYYWHGEHIRLKRTEGERLGENVKQSFFLTADTASKLKDINDYTVICVWCIVEPWLDMCLVDVFRDRIPIPHMLPVIKAMYNKWKATAVIIEEASSGISLIQEATMTERGAGMSVIPFMPHGKDKVQRAQKAAIMMRAGRVFFPISDHDTLNNCINELLQFPDAAHDDFVDNIAMAAQHVHSMSLERMGQAADMPRQAVGGLQTPLVNSFRRSY